MICVSVIPEPESDSRSSSKYSNSKIEIYPLLILKFTIYNWIYILEPSSPIKRIVQVDGVDLMIDPVLVIDDIREDGGQLGVTALASTHDSLHHPAIILKTHQWQTRVALKIDQLHRSMKLLKGNAYKSRVERIWDYLENS